MKTNPSLHLFELPALWDREAWLTNQENHARFEVAAASIPVGVKSLLDVGTGNGLFLSCLESKNVQFVLTGLEPSLAGASARLCRAVVHVGSGDAIPFADGSFDVVTALEVLEHLPCGVFESCLRELSRVALMYILVTVPYRDSLWKITCQQCGCKFNPYYHVRSFVDGTFVGLIPGFELVKVEPFGEVLRQPVLEKLARVKELLGGRGPTYDHAVCPQCNFGGTATTPAEPRRVEVANRQAAPKSIRLKRIVRRLIPAQHSYHWYMALYRRSQPEPRQDKT